MPFVPVDCAALPSDLFVSQLFGHLPGAFTGARHGALGAFRAADGGVIFLDEIGELDLMLQCKLLRTIQERTVIPLGTHQGTLVNVRMVVATNRELKEEVRTGRFREDLYYRLNVVSVMTVPLRERLEDVAVLAHHFLDRLTVEAGLPQKRLSAAAYDLLLHYDWPGNVRELHNHLERAVVFTPGNVLTAESFPEIVMAVAERQFSAGTCRSVEGDVHPESLGRCATDRAQPLRPGLQEVVPWMTMAEVERNHILQTLQQTAYNQSAAARLLNVDRHALLRKIKKLGLDLSRSQRGRPPKPCNDNASEPQDVGKPGG
jgi:transcriptional regulator with PAS, ATPase and Fis domain